MDALTMLTKDVEKIRKKKRRVSGLLRNKKHVDEISAAAKQVKPYGSNANIDISRSDAGIM